MQPLASYTYFAARLHTLSRYSAIHLRFDSMLLAFHSAPQPNSSEFQAPCFSAQLSSTTVTTSADFPYIWHSGCGEIVPLASNSPLLSRRLSSAIVATWGSWISSRQGFLTCYTQTD